ncbi:MAG: rRNA maturation RNase YbeY [Deltaproteobacteria bacterium]
MPRRAKSPSESKQRGVKSPRESKQREIKAHRGSPITVTVRNERKGPRIDGGMVRRIINGIISLEDRGRRGEAAVRFVSDPAIRLLNRRFHGRDCPTDVLAFDLGDGPELLADIIVSVDTARVNAAVFHTTPLSECYLYVIHGTLHLAGYRDSTPRQRARMRKKERFYVDRFLKRR